MHPNVNIGILNLLSEYKLKYTHIIVLSIIVFACPLFINRKFMLSTNKQQFTDCPNFEINSKLILKNNWLFILILSIYKVKFITK